MSLKGAIAAHRFGLGARPGEIDAASADPAGWLSRQVDAGAEQPESLDGNPLIGGGALVAQLLEVRRALGRQRQASLAENAQDGQDAQALVGAFKAFAQVFRGEIKARLALGFKTERPFAEHLVWFWSNHFTVAPQNGALSLVGAYEREAIRPNINRTFEDMLLAVVTHPAMQLYLNNAQSLGPRSLAGRISGKGLNENLGRELMELHTLGVDGGYTQADVIALATLLTGWSIDGDGTGFRYYPARHEPGGIAFRGKTYPSGEEGGRQALKDLAHDPATARHVARQMATHFIADDPPSASVKRLEDTFTSTGGDLAALAHALAADDAAWTPALSKMRSPIEYVTAAYRFFGWPRPGGDQQKQVMGALGAIRLMGQLPLSAPSPKGWPDQAMAWAGSDAILNRIAFAKAAGDRMPKVFDAGLAAHEGLGPLLQPSTVSAMNGAATPGEALALLFCSPEFQRR